MKKIMLFLAISVSLCFSSCQNSYEEAYLAETIVRVKKQRPELIKHSLEKCENNFIELYKSFSEEEREAYKQYRQEMIELDETDYQEDKATESEARSLLN